MDENAASLAGVDKIIERKDSMDFGGGGDSSYRDMSDSEHEGGSGTQSLGDSRNNSGLNDAGGSHLKALTPPGASKNVGKGAQVNQSKESLASSIKAGVDASGQIDKTATKQRLEPDSKGQSNVKGAKLGAPPGREATPLARQPDRDRRDSDYALIDNDPGFGASAESYYSDGEDAADVAIPAGGLAGRPEHRGGGESLEFPAEPKPITESARLQTTRPVGGPADPAGETQLLIQNRNMDGADPPPVVGTAPKVDIGQAK